ncbi:MAG: DUF1501 domain-containing protein [Proteobacteria bacterium]|nr:DUF1501 domain-containing protein [Pseudomonadota bacterium]
MLTRRDCLRRSGALASLGLGLSAMRRASAVGATDYKALVCIFLFGGNDPFNTVLATDAPSWSAYGNERGNASTGIALAPPGTPAKVSGTLHQKLGGVLPIVPATPQASRSFALHPSLAGLRELFNQQRLGVVANVGHLIDAQTTKADYHHSTARRPAKLGSHNDQQSVWQSGGAEGTTRGWGGRFMDGLIADNTQPMFSAISIYGSAVWLPGQSTRAYQLSSTGPVRISDPTGAATVYGSAEVLAHMRAIMSTARDNRLIEREHAAVSQRSFAATDVLGGIYPAPDAGPWGSRADALTDPLLKYRDPVTRADLYNPLAHQLQAVARTIAVRDALGMGRQVFFVGLGGWDTHATQPTRHAPLLAQLAQALTYFDDTLRQMGVDDQVTTFTMSEFGRALTSNGDGCDHGWGGHQFVMGGAVKGGDIYGRFPTYSGPDPTQPGTFASPDMLDSGQLLPALGVDQYAATLGTWLGVSDAELAAILPNLSTWAPADRNLGFMRP